LKTSENSIPKQLKKCILLSKASSHNQIKHVIQDTGPDIVINEISEPMLQNRPWPGNEILEDLFEDARDIRLRIDSKNGYEQIGLFNQLTHSPGSNGLLLMSEGTDPGFVLPSFNFPSDFSFIAKITLTVPENTDLQVYYMTKEMPYFNEHQVKTASLEKGIRDCFIKFDPGNYTGSLRIDPGKIKGKFILHSIEVRCIKLPA